MYIYVMKKGYTKTKDSFSNIGQCINPQHPSRIQIMPVGAICRYKENDRTCN